VFTDAWSGRRAIITHVIPAIHTRAFHTLLQKRAMPQRNL